MVQRLKTFEPRIHESGYRGPNGEKSKERV
jgi:hypothetical protein